MREIKFRAYIKATNKIEEVISINFDTKTIITKNIHCYEFKDVILMQYTELKDKNVEKIYEGDILLAPEWFGRLKCVCIYQQENNVNPIQGFGLYSYDSYFRKYNTLVESDEWDEFEVIGNIYDNPELLEKGE